MLNCKLTYSTFFLFTANFNKAYKIIDERISSWRSKTDKEQYLENFSKELWNKCAEGRKRMHIISKCDCCQTTTTVQFPIRRGHENTLKKREPFTQLNVTANKAISKSSNTSCKSLLKEVKTNWSRNIQELQQGMPGESWSVTCRCFMPSPRSPTAKEDLSS